MATQQEEENKALIRRWLQEVWNEKKPEVIDELLTPDVKAHGMGPNGTVLTGPAAFRSAYDALTGAFPDVEVTVELMIASGDTVATYLTARATHGGDHLGVPATGAKVTFPVMSMARIVDGKIVEGWNVLDLLTVLQQVQAVPKESLAQLP
jgi:steroid delta-isomerase-like uncharacterized protein